MTYRQICGQSLDRSIKALRKDTKTMKLTSLQFCLAVLAVVGLVFQYAGSSTAWAQSVNNLTPGILNQLQTFESQIKEIQMVLQQTPGLCAPDDLSCPLGPLTSQLQQLREKYGKAAAAVGRNRIDEAISHVREIRTLLSNVAVPLLRLRLPDQLKIKFLSQLASVQIGTADVISELELVALDIEATQMLDTLRQAFIGICNPDDLTCPINPLTRQIQLFREKLAKSVFGLQQRQYRIVEDSLQEGQALIKSVFVQVGQLRLPEQLKAKIAQSFQGFLTGIKGAGLQVRVTDLGSTLADLHWKLVPIFCIPGIGCVPVCPPGKVCPPDPPCPPDALSCGPEISIAVGFDQVKDKFENAFTEIDLDRFTSAIGPLRESQVLVKGIADQVGKLPIAESLKSQALQDLQQVQVGIQETLVQLGN